MSYICCTLRRKEFVYVWKARTREGKRAHGSHLGAGGGGEFDHGLQQVGGDDDGFALLAAPHDHLLLHRRHVLQRYLGACGATAGHTSHQTVQLRLPPSAAPASRPVGAQQTLQRCKSAAMLPRCTLKA